MRILLLCSTIVLILSCGSKNKLPGHVLKQDKMEAVLWDMMRADQFLSDYVFIRDSAADKDKASINFYKRIFADHGITREQFRESFEYYQSNPGQLKIIMDSIMNKKELRPEELYKPKLADSSYRDTNQKPAVISDSPAFIRKPPDVRDSTIKLKRPRKIPAS